MLESDNPLASDDPEVWTTLVNSVHPESIMVVIGYRMGPALRAVLSPEDIMQETLLKAWVGRHEFAWQGVSSFRRWLLRIAERCIEDQRDRSQAQKRAGSRTVPLVRSGPAAGSSSGFANQDPWTSTTPRRIIDARDRAAVMERCLESLPDEVRDFVRLRVFEELQVDEIAKRTGIGAEAVRYRVRKGAEVYRERLKAMLGSSSTFRP